MFCHIINLRLMKILRCIAALACLAVCGKANASGLLVEAESFSSRGGWVVDQQAMDVMGSPYLLAHGMGKPVEDAVTTVDIPRGGVWHIYVRTYNWTSPWSDKPGPGAFRVRAGGKTVDAVLGTEGNSWMWQYAGKVRLKAGCTELALCDATGFDGRCDAIYLTDDAGDVPPDSCDLLSAFREEKGGVKPVVSGGDYDLVVVGGGIAGMCAAVAAARGGCRVALVNDRPVLGGNNSSEVRVHLGGHAEIGPYPALGRMLREFGHSRQGNAQPADYYEDDKKSRWIAAEDNIALFAPYHAVSVEMEDSSSIRSVVVQNILTGERLSLSAPLFSDCTGDASVGYMAGADWRTGREAASEFGETLAPETADDMTMGMSVQWYSEDTGKPASFPVFEYGVGFSDDSCEKLVMGEWKWETGMNRDQILEAEMIRDYGLLVVYSNWSWLKNRLADNGRLKNRELAWVAFVGGKRESRRLMGDYIFKQDDIDKNVFHEDASFTASWSIDLHFPDPANTVHFPGSEFKAATVHNYIYPVAVPYRCLYSRNISNLFMAGRNISVTHVALGTVRVMRTTGMMGEVVGMAASVCRRHDALPRDVYRKYLPELKALMSEGAAVEGELPDNQRFNLSRPLKEPKVKLCR